MGCIMRGIQSTFGSLEGVFGGAFGAHEGASEADGGARAQCAPPLGAPLN